MRAKIIAISITLVAVTFLCWRSRYNGLLANLKAMKLPKAGYYSADTHKNMQKWRK